MAEQSDLLFAPADLLVIPFGGKPFERFRVFLELINRFEFEFRRRGFFFERFEFLVCFKVNHTHHVAVHVHVLWLVCAHTIPFRMLWCP